MKTIFKTKTALGGYVFRITSDGTTVNIAESREGASWRIVRRMSARDFDLWSSEVDLFNAYDQNPAKIARLISEEN